MHDSTYVEKAKKILAQTRGKTLTVEARRELAIELAALMLKEARREVSTQEKRYADELGRMLEDPLGKDFAATIADELFRSKSNLRTADQLGHILRTYGIPRFLSSVKRVQLKAVSLLGKHAASLVVPLAKRMLRKQTSAVIIPAEKRAFTKHVQQRMGEELQLNINYLGEAILGEKEAQMRLQRYLDFLADPQVTYVSVKISSIYSQIKLIDPEKTLEVLKERLRALYRAAAAHSPEKFVNLDMEEYDDLRLTVELFKQVLEEPEFAHLSAGIVLQAYLPDSYLYQQELTLWAIKRLASGGAPIKIRLVKGANLVMEQYKARLKGWPQAPYPHKVDVDANYKRMLAYGLMPENAHAVHIGVGSHNLFDVAYAMLLQVENGLREEIDFEMLEGMAMPHCRVVQRLCGRILLYCPVASEGEFQHAVSYLVRRLDENTGPDNFLRYAFNMIPGTLEWQKQASLFSLACHATQTVSFKRRKTQNRLTEEFQVDTRKEFSNAADTDWSLEHHSSWAKELTQPFSFAEVPGVVEGEEIFPTDRAFFPIVNPSASGELLTRATSLSAEEVERALASAEAAESTWGQLAHCDRDKVLAEAARLFKMRRSALIRAMLFSSGKSATEADSEVSEAIDFIEYYRRSAGEWAEEENFSPRGVTTVLSPWNFPCAIAIGGISSALAAGNPVLFKPAPEALLVGYEVAKIFWEAGVPKDALHFLPAEEGSSASALITDPRVKKVLLTGATETAKKLYGMRPGLDLAAETGGKNALIVTALADRDLAIKDIVSSAFGFSGQKCSALSVLILEKEVYQDKKFLQNLKDAVESLAVGPSTDLESVVTPLISIPSGKLKEALTTLEEGEEWLVEPRQHPENPYLWSPGVKLNVRPGSKTHQTEFFGPVLGILCAENLTQAIAFAKQVPYGLTSGIHTLDEREIEKWRAANIGGNLYVNRGITGAIVRRQPFGGYKASSFGDGYKAGGPNMLRALMRVSPQQKTVEEAVESYQKAWEEHFSLQHDETQILGQHNLFSYTPYEETTLRLVGGEDPQDVAKVCEVFRICSSPLVVSIAEGVTAALPESISPVVESVSLFTARVEKSVDRRVRFLKIADQMTLSLLASMGATLLTEPVSSSGRVELLHALREVATSYDYHRYGNVPLTEPEGL